MHKTLLCTLVTVALLVTFVSADTAQCKDFGFSPDQLHCSTCDQMKIFFSDKDLLDKCRECCTDNLKEADHGDTEQSEKYASGVLEVCPWKLRGFAEVDSFIDNKATQFNNLKVDHKHGMSPQLVMKKKTGTTDTISISNWKQDQIIEFLKEKLEE